MKCNVNSTAEHVVNRADKILAHFFAVKLVYALYGGVKVLIPIVNRLLLLIRFTHEIFNVRSTAEYLVNRTDKIRAYFFAVILGSALPILCWCKNTYFNCKLAALVYKLHLHTSILHTLTDACKFNFKIAKYHQLSREQRLTINKIPRKIVRKMKEPKTAQYILIILSRPTKALNLNIIFHLREGKKKGKETFERLLSPIQAMIYHPIY